MLEDTNSLDGAHIIFWLQVEGVIHPDVTNVLCLFSQKQEDLGNKVSNTVSGNSWEFEPPHDKTNKMACAPSKDSESDQSLHI